MKTRTFAHAIWIKCTGEAHEPGNYSDHCMVCMPFWESYPTCPECGSKLSYSKKIDPDTKEIMCWCRDCKRHIIRVTKRK